MTNTLLQELKNCGVDSEHINKMDQEKPLSLAKLERYYEYRKGEEKEKLVDVAKIKGLTDSRLNGNCTWWEHFNGKAEVLAQNRIENLFKSLKEVGLSQFMLSFQKPQYRVPLAYFDKEDIYVAYGDGNHRTVFAKIVNAPYIFAKVSYYKYNPTFEHNYLQHKKLLDNLRNNIKKLGFRLNNNWITYKDVQVVDVNIPMPSGFDLTDEDMLYIHAKFKRIQKDLAFLEEKVYLLRFFSMKWKIRICNFFSHFGNDYDKMFLYRALASLFEEGYTVPKNKD